MNHYSDVYPVEITKLQKENKYLKEEIEEEKEKLEQIIKTLKKEIEETKEDNRKLNNEIEYNLKMKEKIYYKI
jgi:RNase adaptor protein for sRNA GlmZ degradation